MDISFTRVLIVTAVLVTVLWVPLGAQDKTAEPPNILTSVKALKCRFPAATSATWAQPAVSGNRIFIKDASSITLWTLE